MLITDPHTTLFKYSVASFVNLQKTFHTINNTLCYFSIISFSGGGVVFLIRHGDWATSWETDES
jgi:hypothetical protein